MIEILAQTPTKHGASLSSTVTSDPFDAPAGSLLVVTVAASGSSGGTVTTVGSVTNSGPALPWTTRVVLNSSDGGNDGLATICTAPTWRARTGMTVTVTTTGATSTTRRPSLKVYVLADVDMMDPVVGIGGILPTGNTGAGSFTQVANGSFLIVAAADWTKRGVPSSPDLTVDAWDQPGTDGVSGLFGYRQLGTGGDAETYSVDGAGTLACEWNVVRVEFRPAPVPAPSTAAGVPFLPNELGPDGRLAVEVAFGADLADWTSWTWTEVTQDVRADPGISTSLGRGDEAGTSQPATCALVLDNTSGNYSLGGGSAYWPNVRRNTPIRVLVDPGDDRGWRTAFLGFAVGWTPSWDAVGKIPTVELEAAGTLRRLSQGQAPVSSTYRRAAVSSPTVVAYWPMEDGEAAQFMAAALEHPAMSYTGEPKLSSSEVFVASAPLPVLNGATFSAPVPNYPSTGQVQVRFLAEFPEDDEATGAVLCRVLTSGTVAQWDLIYETGFGGMISMTAYNSRGVQVGDTVGIGFNVQQSPRPRRWSIELMQSGANIVWRFGGVDFEGGGSGYWTPTTITNQTLGVCTGVVLNPGGALKEVAVGHVTVENTRTDIYADFADFAAYRGELATDRLYRLCQENGVPITIIGTSTARMGPQPIATLLDLLRECEAVDQGVLYDGVGVGLRYVCRDVRENAVPALTVAAEAGELAQPFTPVHDDQRIRNKVTATRSGGVSVVYEDTDGPLGTAAVGIYDTSIDVNCESDGSVGDYAGWLVNLGTIDGYRYPTMSLDLRAAPALASNSLEVAPSDRVDITGIDTVLAGFGVEDAQLLVEGVSQQISPTSWRVRANCSPAAPWSIAILAATTGDTDPYLLHLDTDGSTLASAAAADATTLSVSTPSGPRWSTTADDYPLDITVGGVRVTVTAVSGTGTTQTFTTTPLPLARPAGAPVEVLNPPVLGL